MRSSESPRGTVLVLWESGLDKLRARCRSGALGRVKPLESPDFSGAYILSCKKEKNIRSTSFQSNR